eukprot:CAMPEP_0179347632 /NCGR_PEP_ID=MMETSP0797-20121207/73247_1 /TAXON_ID=47934 /ORGANISM="Dinophysis acuminata, Strain DAEP01" /LENGTH=414 /DNA_ID=CAMNT_0021062333 /DNA_START=89 /DNA_END=1332 /DNA_ORIENTATION=-
MGQQISEMAQPYSDMAMLCVSPVAPHTRKESTYGWSQSLGLVWGASGMQGLRERMEDAHLTIPSVQSADEHWNGSGLFGVMDGHGGGAGRELLPEARTQPAGEAPRGGPGARPHRDVPLDEMVSDPANLEELRSMTNVSADDQQPRHHGASSKRVHPDWVGCTAVVCCILRNMLVVANAGDSRAVLCRGGKAIDMSEDHKPNLPRELVRIRKAGGQVFEKQVGKHTVYRVNGDLSLSRALGDFRFKQNPRLAPKDQMISCVPDVQTVKLQPEDEFMVLACDGVWDALGSQEVVDYIRPHLPSIVSGSVPPSAVVEGLLDYCFWPDLAQNRGMGTDNMTMVLVVFAHDRPVKVWGVPRKEGAAMGFPFKAAGMPGVAGKGPVGVPGTMRTGQVGGAGRRRPSAEHTAKGANQFAI